MDTQKLDIEVAVIGGGPAGLTAGLYAARAMRRTALFEHGAVGGQISTTHLVENYPGFVAGASGPDLSFNMLDQAKRFGMEHRMEEVTAIRAENGRFVLEHTEGTSTAGTVILATGARHRELGIAKERELFGTGGVSVCATCDGAFFKDRPVVVLVNGNSASASEAVREASCITTSVARGAGRACRAGRRPARSPSAPSTPGTGRGRTAAGPDPVAGRGCSGWSGAATAGPGHPWRIGWPLPKNQMTSIR